MTYPGSCMSYYCDRALCDGCRHQPNLVKFYTEQGPAFLERYRARQDAARERERAERQPTELP